MTEDRGLGYETREVKPTTRITTIEVGDSHLAPWLQLPEVGPEVSGIAQYQTEFDLDEKLPESRYVLDLGSTSGGLGSVVINGSEPIGYDTSAPRVDVTDFVHEGTNSVTVRVGSSLNNRLLARGYYDVLIDISTMLNGKDIDTIRTEPHAHGLLGPVRLLAERVH